MKIGSRVKLVNDVSLMDPRTFTTTAFVKAGAKGRIVSVQHTQFKNTEDRDKDLVNPFLMVSLDGMENGKVFPVRMKDVEEVPEEGS